MIRNGISEKVAMVISGHKTRSVFDRYNITNYDDLVDAGRKIREGRERIKQLKSGRLLLVSQSK